MYNKNVASVNILVKGENDCIECVLKNKNIWYTFFNKTHMIVVLLIE